MQRWLNVTLVILVAGCSGEIIGDPAVEVTQLGLAANHLGALQAEPCVAQRGQAVCAAYPNPGTCDRLVVSIRGDGSTIGRCTAKGSPERILRGIGQGVPIACRLEVNSGCVQCQDVFGGAVVDTCGRNAALYSGQGFPGSLPEGAAELPAPGASASGQPSGTQPGSTPPGSGLSQCDQQAQQVYLAQFNQILNAEGFAFSWAPDLSKLASDSFFGANAFYFADEICSGDAPGVQDDTGCDGEAKAQGRCYCMEDDDHDSGVECRCGRVTAKVLSASCALAPKDCEPKQWAVALYKVYGAATQWLNGGGLNLFGGPTTVGAVTGPKDIICKGSPLVLDLKGDGIALTSVEDGVTFNLTGGGPIRSAWLQGEDDALLAIDRDGDGAIRGGAELLGEGSRLGGRLARDGFEALAVLDRPDHGGNGNGLVEAGDFLFDQLLLWSDSNHDGLSQPGELRGLREAGIVALELTGARHGRELDRHGNDLSYRARFLRADGGTGTLVDVLFVTGTR